tara:strand:+ start:430 stop:600 length:171 start_codon:yes stop_codon:yes gene_type:complete
MSDTTLHVMDSDDIEHAINMIKITIDYLDIGDEEKEELFSEIKDEIEGIEYQEIKI